MKILKIAFLLLFIPLSNHLVADENELSYGRVDSFTLGQLKIVINDKTFGLSENLKVLNENKRPVSHAALTRGRPILYRYQTVVEGTTWQHVISEIHLIRPGT